MQISKVKLDKIRCFDKLPIDFDQSSSMVISGDNGSGKTALLRSIAMGLCDETSASALLRELPGEFVRKKADDGSIIIELVDGKKKYKIETKIKSLKAFEKVEQKLWHWSKDKWKRLEEEAFPWEKLFVTAYGAGIRTLGTFDYQDYFAVDAVYPLFRYDVPLQNPELAFRRALDIAREISKKNNKQNQIYEKEMQDYLTTLLKKVLNLEEKDVVYLSSTGIRIKSKRWGDVELGALGDGYQGTTTWVLDFISWWILYLELNNRKKDFVRNGKIKGIVLIDEIEKHLHPQWQLKIMSLLQSAFNDIQFIVTTHSPLIISGSGNIPVYKLTPGKPERLNVNGWLAEDVYREIMGLPTSRPKYIQSTLNEFEQLHLKSLHAELTSADKKRMTKLKDTLNNILPGTDPAALLIQLDNILKDIKKSHINK